MSQERSEEELLADLRRLGQERTRLRAELEVVTDQLGPLVSQALARGIAPPVVTKASGLTRQRVHQLKQEKEPGT